MLQCSGACEPPLAWRARKPLPWALRSSAALALGRAMPRAPATELVFWHRVSDCAPKGCGLLSSFLFLLYLFALSALACCSEVTVISVPLPPFVSRRGLSNTNQRLSLGLCRYFQYKPSPLSCLSPTAAHSRLRNPSFVWHRGLFIQTIRIIMHAGEVGGCVRSFASKDLKR